MKVAFRVDSSARIGGGHVMRCLTLADELKARGAETLFIAAAIPPALAERVRAGGHDLHMIEPPEDLARAGDDWDSRSLSAQAQGDDARRTLDVLGETADWIVVDHYLLDEQWHREGRNAARRLMVIDDLANRRLDCDLLLDQTLGRTADDYAASVPKGAAMLLGASYALLRPEFARLRPAALARRRDAGPVRRILLSLGTTDIGGVTGAVLKAILPVTTDQAIDVVLGAEAQSLARVRSLAQANPRIDIHIDADNMAELMRDADLAIGAAGTTSWERCCLGLPSLTLTLAANQAFVAQALAETGASQSVEPATLAVTLAETIADESARARMTAAAFAIVDGLGAARVADRLTKQAENPVQDTPTLRPAAPSDSEQLWLWRNDPATRTASRTIEPISWSDHRRWLTAMLASGSTALQIAEIGGEPVAMVRFDPEDDAHEVSINVRPDRRGSGLGSAVLRRACQMLEAERGGTQIVAAVHQANSGSQRLFERCGFVRAGGSEGAFLRYVRQAAHSRSRKSA